MYPRVDVFSSPDKGSGKDSRSKDIVVVDTRKGWKMVDAGTPLSRSGMLITRVLQLLREQYSLVSSARCHSDVFLALPEICIDHFYCICFISG